VEDFDDDEAFLQLVVSNAQGELSPLEIGMHAVKAFSEEKGVGGRGKKGGLSAYAGRIGRSQQSVFQLQSAARVVTETYKSFVGLPPEIADRTTHLTAISTAPESTWSAIVDELVTSIRKAAAKEDSSKSWTVSVVKSHVDTINKFKIPPEHQSWLPLPEVVARYLKDNRLSSNLRPQNATTNYVTRVT
jgi:hypothetical protein